MRGITVTRICEHYLWAWSWGQKVGQFRAPSIEQNEVIPIVKDWRVKPQCFSSTGFWSGAIGTLGRGFSPREGETGS